LDLARPDAVAGRGDDVVVAAEEVDIAVAVLDALIAGDHPVADEFLFRRFRVLPVFEEHHRVGPAHGDLARLAGLHLAAFGVDHRDLVAGHRLADGAAAADAERGAGGENEVALGLAVGLVYRQAELFPRPVIGFAAERFAGRAD